MDDSSALADWFEKKRGVGDGYWCPSCGRWGCLVGMPCDGIVAQWVWSSDVQCRRAEGPTCIWSVAGGPFGVERENPDDD